MISVPLYLGVELWVAEDRVAGKPKVRLKRVVRWFWVVAVHLVCLKFYLVGEGIVETVMRDIVPGGDGEWVLV